MNYDLEYILSNLTSLTDIPSRLLKNDEFLYSFYFSKFSKDPAELVKNEILKADKKLGFIITKDFLYYSYLKIDKENIIIIGPHFQIKPTKNIFSKLVLDLELSKQETPLFINSINHIPNRSLESITQILCLINYVFTNQKIHLRDIIIDEKQKENLDYSIQNKNLENKIDEISFNNNAYLIEQNVSKLVEEGNVKELENFINNAPSVKSGILSNNMLRQLKNTFICATTTFSRAAIKGMLDEKEALELSDLYIQKMELLNNPNEISALQLNMVLDYTKRVEMIKKDNEFSLLLININKYIVNHISEPIRVNDLCNALYISKTSLFDKLKKEANLTVNQYIINYKINEAKKLLKYTNRTLSSISIYLGFSSQSHFTRTFKAIVKLTPIQYRIQRKNNRHFV